MEYANKKAQVNEGSSYYSPPHVFNNLVFNLLDPFHANFSPLFQYQTSIAHRVSFCRLKRQNETFRLPTNTSEKKNETATPINGKNTIFSK